MQLQSSTLTKLSKYYLQCNKYNNDVPQIQSVPDQFRQRFSSPANNHLSPFRVSEGHRWTNPDEDDDDTHCRMFCWKIEILKKPQQYFPLVLNLKLWSFNFSWRWRISN